jgi:hypothetical protein
MPVPFRAFQGHPVRRTNTIAFMASRLGTRGLWQPSGCGGGEGKSGSIFAHSSSGIVQRSSLVTRPMRTAIARFGCRGQFFASSGQPRTVAPGRWSLMERLVLGQAPERAMTLPLRWPELSDAGTSAMPGVLGQDDSTQARPQNRYVEVDQ